MKPRINRVVGAFVAAVIVVVAGPALAQQPGTLPQSVGGGFSATAGDFEEGRFEPALDGLPGIQAADPAVVEARHKGVFHGLNTALELFVNRPRDLLVIGIIGNFDTNDVGLGSHRQGAR